MKKILIVYIIFTLVKLFTAKIDFQVEEAPYIVLKAYPTITNTIRTGEDSYLEKYWDQDAWYAKGKYVILLKTSGNVFISKLYEIIIYLWWILSAILLCLIIKKVLRFV